MVAGPNTVVVVVVDVVVGRDGNGISGCGVAVVDGATCGRGGRLQMAHATISTTARRRDVVSQTRQGDHDENLIFGNNISQRQAGGWLSNDTICQPKKNTSNFVLFS